ncbi:hypothetical protein [Nocardia cyriacigeorgica]|uniref:hypothetical protein n=1 Tax=Nocardia cyriacigeorgica TaxID=135487 RepID=UPI001894BF87|nr:hypothetical protein [Nocardia cyriacigeorgica]MBF6287824.1 hypothetical protein [Nocardia cyriacigeorgica]
MAIKRGYRFPIEFSTAFPRQLLLMGEIGPAIKYNPDRNAVQEQEYDFNPKTGEGTGLPLWKATVTDPDEGNHDGNKGKAKRASFEITFISSHQPVPVTEEVVPGTGLRMIELEGLTAEPRVMGQGEFKYLGYVFYATGIKGDTNTPRADAPNSSKATSTNAAKAAA